MLVWHMLLSLCLSFCPSVRPSHTGIAPSE